MFKKHIIFFFILLLVAAPAICAQSPQDILKVHIDRVIDVLKDPSLTGEAGKKIKIEKISEITEDIFDFTELSKRSLGRAWKQFTPEQQTEFVSLYKKLLKNTYADRIVSYNNEKIKFGKEVRLSDTATEVQTTIGTQTGDVSINYRMMQDEVSWRVYDVVIEGVSLINNYRTQFRGILANNTPAGLIEILKKKVE
jgi:phospholipid transport system substrate-binding protein